MSMDEKAKSLIKTAIVKSGKLRKDSKCLKNVRITKIESLNVTPCVNPDSNYFFKGDVTITVSKSTESGNDLQEYPCCEVCGLALVENNEAHIINGVSIDRGFTHIL